MRRLAGSIAGLWVLTASLPAMAGAVELRQEVVSQDGKVTLGDLFGEAGAAKAVVVAKGQAGAAVVLDANRIQTLARANGLDWSNERGVRRIIVQVSGSAPVAAAPAGTHEPARTIQTLTFTHNLEAGELVQAQDLTWSKTADTPLDAPLDPDAVIGMAVRRAMREGSAVSMHDVAAPLVIKKDDVIAVTFSMGGIALTLQAKALENAITGQPLNVLNPSSKKILQAVAVGPGQAIVGPQADQLKASARSTLSRLALR